MRFVMHKERQSLVHDADNAGEHSLTDYVRSGQWTAAKDLRGLSRDTLRRSTSDLEYVMSRILTSLKSFSSARGRTGESVGTRPRQPCVNRLETRVLLASFPGVGC